jgi:4-amino-4-deoxy-L-arabinose transferase-like glycosyltransferase
MSDYPQSQRRQSSNRSFDALLLVLAYASFVIIPLLGYSQIFQVSEAREGVVVNEILSSGDLVLPKRNGEIVPSKPIFFHWVDAAFASVLGGMNEFVLRLPSALAGVATTAVLFLLVSSLHNAGAGFIAALLLLSSYGFLRMSQDGRVDMLFNAFVIAAIVHWIRSAWEMLKAEKKIEEIDNRTYRTIAILCGLAFLTKGPLGVALSGLVIVAIAWSESRLSGVRSVIRFSWIWAVLIPAPWYIAAALQGDQAFVGRQIVFENISRFVGGEGISNKPFWFYIPHFVGQGAPWSILFLVYAGFLLRAQYRLWKSKADAANPFIPSAPGPRFGVRAGLIWIGVIFLFLSLSAGKRRGYLLTTLPPLVMILALRFSITWERLRHPQNTHKLVSFLRYEVFCWGALVWLVAAVSALVFYGLNEELQVVSTFAPRAQDAFKSLDAVISRGGIALLITAVFFGVASIALWTLGFRRGRPGWAAIAIIVFIQFILSVHVSSGLAIKGITHTYKDFANHIARIVPEERKINFVKTRKDESFDGFFFYFDRHVTMIDPKSEEIDPGLYLARRSWIDSRSDAEKAKISKVTEGGRIADEPGEVLVLFLYGLPSM